SSGGSPVADQREAAAGLDFRVSETRRHKDLERWREKRKGPNTGTSRPFVAMPFIIRRDPRPNWPDAAPPGWGAMSTARAATSPPAPPISSQHPAGTAFTPPSKRRSHWHPTGTKRNCLLRSPP